MIVIKDKIWKSISCSLLCILFVSCTKGKEVEYRYENGKFVKDVYNEKGELTAQVSLNKDTVGDGVTLYYEDGILKRKIWFKNGKPHGKDISFYPDGSIEQRLQWIQGKRVYERNVYHKDASLPMLVLENGDTVIKKVQPFKKFSFFNSDEEIAFERTYDKEAKLIKTFGKPTVEIYTDPLPGKVGESFHIDFRVATPPYTERNFFIGEMTTSGVVTKVEEYPIDYDFGVVQFDFEPKKAGTYKYVAIYNLYDFNIDSLESDTTLLNIPVVE